MWQIYQGEALLFYPGGVHLWRAKLNQSDIVVSENKSLLSVGEAVRADRFIKSEDSSHYVMSCAIVRKVLSKYLQIEPARVEFSIGEQGKPYIAGGDIQFNISHSGDYVLIGVTKGRSIGVDVERVRLGRDFLSLAERFFAPSEYLTIKKLPSQDQLTAFYRTWTRKEAFIKATGLGLSLGLSNFEVSVLEDQSVESCLLDVSVHQFLKTDWILRSILFDEIKKSYFAAFSVRGMIDQINYWDFE